MIPKVLNDNFCGVALRSLSSCFQKRKVADSVGLPLECLLCMQQFTRPEFFVILQHAIVLQNAVRHFSFSRVTQNSRHYMTAFSYETPRRQKAKTLKTVDTLERLLTPTAGSPSSPARVNAIFEGCLFIATTNVQSPSVEYGCPN